MLDISQFLLLTVGSVFLLLLFTLHIILFRPLLNHIDERENQLKEDLLNANSSTSDIDSIMQEANDIVAKAKNEARLILEDTYKNVEIESISRIDSVKKDIDIKYRSFLNDLSKEKKLLKESLLVELPKFKDMLNSKLKRI
jgi:F-type H+-transporting ATPase subunit b